MLRNILFALSLVLLFTLAFTVGPAMAQEPVPPTEEPAPPPEEEILPCAGGSLSGTVVAVDEATQTVTVQTETGLCTATLDKTYDHPIVALLGMYFGDISADSFEEALSATEVCATLSEDGTAGTLVSCDTEGAVPVKVTGMNEDGTFNADVVGEEGKTIFLTVEDEELAGNLSGALEALAVAWEIAEDGSLIQVGDEIAAYHEAGMGFGVLTKLYSMAAEAACPEDEAVEGCDVTVESLVAEFNSGTGMGQLFKKYGKPDKTGVGHVRQEVNGKGANKKSGTVVAPTTEEGSTDDTQDPSVSNYPPSAPGQGQDKDKNKDKGPKNNSVCNTPANGKAKGKGASNCP